MQLPPPLLTPHCSCSADLAALQRWFQVLAEELASRMATDEAQYRRRPRNLIVHYRTGETMGARLLTGFGVPPA